MDDRLTIATATGVDISLPIAGIGGRSYAFITDWHIRVILALAWFMVGTAVYAALAGTDGFTGAIVSSTGVYLFTVVVPSLALYFLYHLVLEMAMRGRTPGKRMGGVRIVTVEGHTPGVAALLLRNIFRLLDSLPVFYALGLVVAFVTRRQVRIGDLAAGTVLVYVEPAADRELRELSAYQFASGLAPEQAELVRELLERWKDLDDEARRRLGYRLLQALGHGQGPWPHSLPELRAQLARLAGDVRQ